MEQLLENVREFLDSAERDFKEGKYNASTSSFFKAIVVMCDFLIYQETKRLPKNHSDRFNLLKIYFKDIYEMVLGLFKPYREAYNLKSSKEDATKVRSYANEIEKFVRDKKKA